MQNYNLANQGFEYHCANELNWKKGEYLSKARRERLTASIPIADKYIDNAIKWLETSYKCFAVATLLVALACVKLFRILFRVTVTILMILIDIYAFIKYLVKEYRRIG